MTFATRTELLRFHVLGLVEVLRDGVSCAPRSPKQRTLLTILLLHPNQMLSTDMIIDLLWSSHPPRSASAALQMHVSGVRRTLTGLGGPGDEARRHPVLRTEPCGYSIRLQPGQLDLSTFRTLVRDGHRDLAAGRCAEAGARFDQALRQWRGRAIADVAATGALAGYALLLEEECLAVRQQRIGVDLCQGSALRVVGELAELCARHPLREDLHQQHMIALSQVGRTAEALRAYTAVRAAMVAEAGIEPGLGLRATHQAILRGDRPADPVHSCRPVGFQTGVDRHQSYRLP